jgi:hypothetical protein
VSIKEKRERMREGGERKREVKKKEGERTKNERGKGDRPKWTDILPKKR